MRCYPALEFSLIKAPNSVAGTTKLEGPDLLKVLALEGQLGVKKLIERGAAKNRCSMCVQCDSLSRGPNVADVGAECDRNL